MADKTAVFVSGSLCIIIFCLAAFKIVKGWLGPDAISMLKFTNKNEVQEYISVEYLPAYMGGIVSILKF